jgi:hypothetical protein
VIQDTTRLRRRHLPLVGTLDAALLVSAALAFGSWVLVAVVHIHDRFHVDHVSGAWMSLAKYVNEGILYPPLYDGWSFGGTRYMPLKILLDAGGAQLSGEYLLSGKLVALLIFVALLTVLFIALRNVGCSPALAAVLTALPLLTGNGFYGATSDYGDALPVMLQLLAVVLIATDVTARRASISALLCALALFAKFSAVWGAAAIVIWFALYDRRLLARFSGTFVLAGGALLVLFELGTRGRFGTNVFGLGGAGFGGPRLLITSTPHKLFAELREAAPELVLLVPFVLVSFLVALLRRRPNVYQLCLVAGLVVLVVVLSDVGASTNHLLDVEVLMVIVAGSLIAAIDLRYRQALQLALGFAVLIGLLVSYAHNVESPTREVVRKLTGRPAPRYPVKPLQGYIRPSDTLLSQDPSVPIAYGELPVVLDPFMLLRIDREHPEWGDELIRRLDQQVFDKIVMFGVPDPGALWWRTHHFGPRIAAAIFRNYRRAVTVSGYSIYVPSHRQAG